MENFIDKQQHEITAIYYFSAYAEWMPDKKARHEKYIAALLAIGVTPILGEFKLKDRSCPRCKHRWTGHEEKESDVNAALYLLNEAYKDSYDEAFLVTRDSDLAPPVRMVLTLFPNKRIKIVAPPRLRHSKELSQAVKGKRLASIKDIHVERSLLPQNVIDYKTGNLVAKRPSEYDPPTS